MCPRPRNVRVSFKLHRAHRVAFDDDHMNSPDGFIVTRALAPVRQNRVFGSEEFRFNKEMLNADGPRQLAAY